MHPSSGFRASLPFLLLLGEAGQASEARRPYLQPVWYTGLGEFHDAVLEVHMRRSGSSAAEGAQAEFEYQGCGKARFTMTGAGLGAPYDHVLLDQLTSTWGVPSCQPSELRPRMGSD